MIALFAFLIGFSDLPSEPSEPVTRTFRSTNIINTKSIDQLFANTYEFKVGHRFGDVFSGVQNLFGLDLGASIYIGFDFALTDDLMVGVSRLNLGKTYEVHAQYRLIHQKSDNSFPIGLAFFGQYEAQTQKNNDTHFGMASVLISRKWNKWFSTQISPFYIQRIENRDLFIGAQPVYGATFAFNALITKTISLIGEWSPLLNREGYNQNSPDTYKNDGLSIGLNFEVAGHSFQILASNTQQISTITSLLGSNQNMFDRHFFLGFNLTRLYSLDGSF